MLSVLFAFFALLGAEDVCSKEPVQIIFLGGSDASLVAGDLQKALEESFLRPAALQMEKMAPESDKARVKMLYEQIVLLLAEHGEYLIVDEESGSLSDWKRLLKDYQVLFVNLNEKEEAGFDLQLSVKKGGRDSVVKQVREAFETPGCLDPPEPKVP